MLRLIVQFYAQQVFFFPECKFITLEKTENALYIRLSMEFIYWYALSRVKVKWLFWTLGIVPYFDAQPWLMSCCFKWSLRELNSCMCDFYLSSCLLQKCSFVFLFLILFCSINFICIAFFKSRHWRISYSSHLLFTI